MTAGRSAKVDTTRSKVGAQTPKNGRKSAGSRNTQAPASPLSLASGERAVGVVKGKGPIPQPDGGTFDEFESMPSAIMGGIEFGRPYLTLHGIEQVRALMAEHYPSRVLLGRTSTIGQQLVEGAVGREDFEPLYALLRFVFVYEDKTGLHYGFPKNHHKKVRPGKLAECLSDFFKQTGLEWMEEIIKNSSAAITANLDAMIAGLAPAIAADYLKEMIGELATAREQTGDKTAIPDAWTRDEDENSSDGENSPTGTDGA